MNALYIVFRFCSVVRMSLCQNRCHLADTDPPWYSIYGGFLPAKDASLKMSLACCGSVLLKSHAVAEYNWRFFAMADPCSSWLHSLSLMVTSSQILREAVKMGQAWESSRLWQVKWLLLSVCRFPCCLFRSRGREKLVFYEMLRQFCRNKRPS